MIHKNYILDVHANCFGKEGLADQIERHHRPLVVNHKFTGGIEPEVILDRKANLVRIRELEIRDPDFFEIISDQTEGERLEFLEKALKIGAIALRDMVVMEKIDLVERKFHGLSVNFERMLQENKEGLEGELNKIFGENGELEICLEKLFGDEGKLVHNILDMDNRNSPVGRLREKIESYFVGKNSEVYAMLDPNQKDSPICRLRQEIMRELDSLKSLIEGQIVRKEIIKKTTQKGFEFEDMLEVFLQSVSRPFNDIVERVGKEKGKLGNLKGDYLITISDPTIEGCPPRIVIEAKAGENITLTQKGLLGELDEAIKNREAKFAIAVMESYISEPIGNYREIPPDKIICTFREEGLPLEVAYKVARARLLLDIYEEMEKEIDIGKINGIVGKISNDLNLIRGITAKLTNIGRTSEQIKIDIKGLETNIRDSLIELQDSLRTPGSPIPRP